MICGFGDIPQELKEKHLTISPSGLIEFKKSPKHYRWKYILKKKEETEAMAQGTMIHKAVLENNKFMEKYFRIDATLPSFTNDELKAKCEELGLKKNGNKAELNKRIIEAQPSFWSFDLEQEKQIALGKQVLSEQKWIMCEEIIKNISEKKLSSHIINNGEKELKAWFLHDSGVLIPFRLDAVLPNFKHGFGSIMDLKTSADISSDYVQRYNYKENRHIQMAAYIQGCTKIFQQQFDKHSFFCFVRSVFPFDIAEYRVTPGFIDAGNSEINVLLKKFIKCKNENYWPGEQEEVQDTDLSSWDYQRLMLDEEHIL